MGHWIKKTRDHECSLPSGWRRGVGSVWRCQCGLTWKILRKESSEGGLFKRTRWRLIDPITLTTGSGGESLTTSPGETP